MDVVLGTDTGQEEVDPREEPVMTVVGDPVPQSNAKKKTSLVDDESIILHEVNGEVKEDEMKLSTMVASPKVGGGNGWQSRLNHETPDEEEEDAELYEGGASNNSSASDVETFNGKIVYNPDGSAYIIEGVDSELSDDEYGNLDLLPFLSSAVKNSLCSSPPLPTSSSSGTKPVVNALHIARHPAFYGALYGQAYHNFLRENHKVPEIPVMHSYRVFTIKDRSNGSDLSRESSTEGSGSDASSYPLWDCGTVPVKPILMCFICKLSFGFTKSFVSHATGEHSLSLNKEERELVSRKNTSAVIQGVSAEPLLSFLEPIPAAASPGGDGRCTSAVSPPSSRNHGSVSSSSSHVVVQCASMATTTQSDATSIPTASSSLSAAVTTVVSASSCPVTSVPDLAVVSSRSSSKEESIAMPSSGFGDDAMAPELVDLANIEKMAKAAAAAANATLDREPTPPSLSPAEMITNGSLNPTASPPQSLHQIERRTGAVSSSTPNSGSDRQQSPASSTDRPISHESAGSVSPKGIIPHVSPTQTLSPIASMGSVGICVHHPDGKTNGVECPKCDMVLGSSRSLGGHMTMMHSRNSCKTLKCPKCNWHYKYQETLEIHMKEKHPENEMTCIYCVTNQAHPRLARGETYTCGYKPYRCEVCNYSTTTKGNLSIHMQSDKHINNVQELQNGNLTPEHMAALQQQQQQQQQQQSQQHSQQAGNQAVSPSSNLGVPSSVVAAAAEALKKAPTAPKPKATWRCDVCNYETNVARNLRIHMTSEKHTHNMMVLQQNMKHMQHLSALQQAQAMEPVFQFHPGLLMPADAQLQPEAAIADMAYNHALLMMASQQQQQQQQQHQQQQQQQHHQRAIAASIGKSHNVGNSPLNMSCPPPAIDVDHPDPTLRPDIPYEDIYKVFQCCVCTLFSTDSLETLGQHVQLDRSRLREDEVLTSVAGTYICKLCTYKTNLKANFQLHCKTDKHLQRLHHVNHIKEGGHRNEWKLKYVNVSNPVQVRCNACDYYTNSLHKMQLHSASPRHEGNGRLFMHLERCESMLRSDTTKSYHCKLCASSFSTKVHLIQHVGSLSHLRNEGIRQMQSDAEPDMREIFVVKEGKPLSATKSEEESRDLKTNDDGELDCRSINDSRKDDVNGQKNSDISMLKQALLEKTKTENSTENGQHSCPFCNYSSNSEVRIQMHVVSQHSQKPMSLSCPLCQERFNEWNLLENHLLDVHHVTQEGMQRLLAMVDQTEWMGNDTPSTKPSTTSTSTNSSNTTTTNGPKKTTNDTKATANPMFSNNNGTDGVTTVSNLSKSHSMKNTLDIKEELMDIDAKSDSSDSHDDNEEYTCHCCGRSYAVVEDLFCHQNEMSHLECKTTPRGTGFFCWKKGCTQFFGTMTAAQFHFKEIHAERSMMPVSERHVYKYRCTQCSLAFKTIEKLHLHMQYHIIRAATKCVLCGRSFRTVLALQKHVETSHMDMTKEELEQYKISLANNPLLTGNGGSGILDPQTTELLKKESNRDELDDDEDAMLFNDENDVVDELLDEPGETKEHQVLEDYINSQAIAEDSYSDPNRKYKCHRCKVAFTKQSYLTSHNKTLLHRKGEKMSYPMEKYLDPNRPFKCEVCKESFTQKNILLVHYNSVSHLHKLKLSMKEGNSTNISTSVSTSVAASTTSCTPSPTSMTTVSSSMNSTSNSTTSSEAEKKPYKCNICKVSYSQASTLDIHIRSVLHQTRASKLHELAMTGQIDLSTPLLERPEHSPPSEQPLTLAETTTTTTVTSTNSATAATPTTSSSTNLHSPRVLDLTTTSQTASTTSTSSETAPQFNFSMHPDHNNILQQTLGLVSPIAQPPVLSQVSSGVMCQRCGATCASQEALLQHQQLYCFFSQHHLPSLLSAAPTTPQPPLLSSLSHAQHSSSLRSQVMAGQIEKEESLEKHSKLSQQDTPSIMQINSQVPQRSPTPGQQMFRSRFSFLRPKPLIFRHLLEGFGFDVVMQFNENFQRRSKKENDKNFGQDAKEATRANESKEKEIQKKIDLPEINRSACNKCGKDFSSIWVLKAHQEETHKDIVPIKAVEKFADDFRNDYEKRNASTGTGLEDIPVISESASPSSSGDLSTGPSSTPVTPGATPLSVPNSATPPATSLGSQISDVSSSVTANHMAAQMQFNQLLMSMGLGMGLPVPMNMGMNINPFAAAMNMHPPLIPLMMPPPLDPLMASAFSHPMMPGGPMDPNFFAAQQKMLQQQQLAQAQQQKRARTRINDDQLKILRAYFDINNSPTEEQLIEMSEKSGLPLKVIKHWFRNTLFKERQRNKDSPYNFSNPPSTFLNLEEYEKTGETKVVNVSGENPPQNTDASSNSITATSTATTTNTQNTGNSSSSSTKPNGETAKEIERNADAAKLSLKDIKVEKETAEENQKLLNMAVKRFDISPFSSTASDFYAAVSAASNNSSVASAFGSMDLRTSLAESFACNPFVNAPSMLPLMPPTSSSPPTSESPHSTGTPSGTPTPSSCSSSGKRANRTRFTDYQIKVLQEFFETNAYPKDDDLEYLSKLLNLSPRVIVVWFQNARQKARKVYENQPPVTTEEENAGRFQRTPGLNYQCKKCLQVFQRYYELIKHQKSSCFKDENPLASQIKILAVEERSQPASSTGSGLPSPGQQAPRVPEKFSGNSNQALVPSNGTYRCDKCSLAFARFDLWREHQIVHMMNPSLFPNYQHSPFAMLQYDSPQAAAAMQMKRKLSDDEESQTDQPRDKRLRTTILPEQLDYLYQQYQVESNPSRKMLENIAKEVGLKKRVVQVWFQNTRARERKGQFRAHQQVIHKRCPFCRALFKARSALESHLATRHADQYTKGDINIDALPDGDGDSNPEDSNSPLDDKMSISVSSPSVPVSCPSTSADTFNSTMKRYYEDSLKKYLDELCGGGQSQENNKELSAPTDLSYKTPSEKSEAKKAHGDSPLDLSKPLKAMMEKSNGSIMDRLNEDCTSKSGIDDARSETYSESTDNMDGEEGSYESNPTSPSGRILSSGSKRFRTQMTTVQLKVMKSIFVDYKTPSMTECENLGKEIGLPKRVIQVWFQNARAKEKKAKLAFAQTFGHDMEPTKPNEECSLCNVKYNLKFSTSSLQEHLFSKSHILNLKNYIDNIKKLTDGQDSDPNASQDPIINHMLPSNSSSSSTTTTTTNNNSSGSHPASALMHMMGLQGLGGLANFSAVSNNSGDKVKAEPTTPKKDSSTNNGEVAAEAKPKTENAPSGKDSNSTPATSASQSSSQENHAMGDFGLPVAGEANASAGLFPYMYAGFPGYYGGMPGAFLHHTMYPGAPPGGMMYDSNMYSTPLSLLQLPPSALPEVTSRLTQPGNSVARFSQDGKGIQDLRGTVPEADFQQATEVTVDVGFVCKKCHMVYPAEVLCLNHQRASCFNTKPIGEIKAMLKLVQSHVECRACRERFTTVVDFKFHCDMDRHVKRVQKIQREVTTSCQQLGNNSLGFNVKPQTSLPQTNSVNKTMANNHMDLLSSSPNSMLAALAGQHQLAGQMQHAMTSPSAQANQMLFANQTHVKNPLTNNAHGMGGMVRNGLPDLNQLFFSSMGMDTHRLGMTLDTDASDVKTNTSNAVGCSVTAGDAGVSIS